MPKQRETYIDIEHGLSITLLPHLGRRWRWYLRTQQGITVHRGTTFTLGGARRVATRARRATLRATRPDLYPRRQLFVRRPGSRLE